MLDPRHAQEHAQRWALPMTLALTAVALELGGESARSALRYERASVQTGELWRLVSGNLVHLGWRHLVLNLAGLLLVVALAGRALTGMRGALIVLGTLLGVGLGLFAFSPAVGWYVGMSGALHGMLAAVVIDSCLDAGTRRWGLAFGALMVFKLGWEQFAGALPLTAEAAGGPVIVVAHLYGAMAGALLATALALRDRGRSRAAARV